MKNMKLITLFFAIFFSTLFAWAGVDLNSASAKDLENLPGIGAVGAKNIMAARPFKSVDDLKNVKGIGDAKFAALKPLVQVTQAPTTAAPAAATPAVPTAATPVSTSKSNQAPATVVNINSASLAQLEALPGIGPVKAQAIMKARPFTSIDDLKKVKGIKEATIAKIRPYVSVQ